VVAPLLFPLNIGWKLTLSFETDIVKVFILKSPRYQAMST
jgi:hypothetical protein